MQIDPGLKQRYSGVLSLILGIIIILIPISVVYIIVGVIFKSERGLFLTRIVI